MARVLTAKKKRVVSLPLWLRVDGSDVVLSVHVVPLATRTRVMGVHEDRLKIQIAAPPADGQANDALLRFLAQKLDVSRAQLELLGGPASKRKTLRIAQITVQRVLLALSPKRDVYR